MSKIARANVKYDLDITSEYPLNLAFGGHISRRISSEDFRENTSIEFAAEIIEGKIRSKTTDTSSRDFLRDFSLFSELVDSLEAEKGDTPLSMNAKCKFRFSVKTKNIPSGLANIVRRNTTSIRAFRGNLELYQLYPRLFRIQKMYGLHQEPASQFRVVAHLMNGTKSQDWVAIKGNSGDELITAMNEVVPFDKAPKGENIFYLVHAHGYECPETKAEFRSTRAPTLREAVTNALT